LRLIRIGLKLSKPTQLIMKKREKKKKQNSWIAKAADSIKRAGLAYKTVTTKSSQHLLINADCEDGMRALPEGSVDLIITDPPYNQNLDYGPKFNDKKSRGEFYSWFRRRLSYIPSLLSSRGSFYLISYPEINARILPFLEDELGLNYRAWITWHYPTNIGHSKKNFTRSQRSILFFTKEKDNYIFNRDILLQPYKNPTAPVIRERIKQGAKGRVAYDTLRLSDLYELNKLSYDVQILDLLKNNSPERLRNLDGHFTPFNDDKKLKRNDHPCQLPLSLLTLFIQVSSNTNSLILDPFAGTFTTSAAAEKLNRSSVGIELNKKFIDFGSKRLSLI